MPALWAVDKLVIVVTPRFIVIVDGRQVRIMKNVESLVQLAACLEFQLSVFKMPATVVDILVLPFFGISNPRFALHVIEPHVLGSLAVGPNILARDAARVAANTLV
jgi:predicted phosphatase